MKGAVRRYSKRGNKRAWMISLPAWGNILFWGTEEEAEKYRVHKARWEQAIARKRPATLQEVRESSLFNWARE